MALIVEVVSSYLLGYSKFYSNNSNNIVTVVINGLRLCGCNVSGDRCRSDITKKTSWL